MHCLMRIQNGNYAILNLCMNSRKDIVNLDINEIIKYFKRYSNPMNMFILPKEIGGLGEIQEFIDEQKYSR